MDEVEAGWLVEVEVDDEIVDAEDCDELVVLVGGRVVEDWEVGPDVVVELLDLDKAT